MSSPKLPIFSGHCKASDLKATAARRAAEAQFLASLPPAARAGIERSYTAMLAGMALLLAAAVLLLAPSPTDSPASAPQATAIDFAHV